MKKEYIKPDIIYDDITVETVNAWTNHSWNYVCGTYTGPTSSDPCVIGNGCDPVSGECDCC